MSDAPTETPVTTEATETSHEAAIAYEEALDAAPSEAIPNGASNSTVPTDVTVETPVGGMAAQPVPIPPVSVVSSPPPQTPSLRLRMKVWTDPRTRKRYLMPVGFFRDVLRGQPRTDVMYAHAMSDDDTKVVTLTAAEWNALPFFYFREDGWSPRATERPGP